MNRKAVVEAIKEVLRLAALAAISAVLSWATTKVASLPPNSVYTLVLTVVLRAVDRYIHKDPGTKLPGIVPF